MMGEAASFLDAAGIMNALDRIRWAVLFTAAVSAADLGSIMGVSTLGKTLEGEAPEGPEEAADTPAMKAPAMGAPEGGE